MMRASNSPIVRGSAGGGVEFSQLVGEKGPKDGGQDSHPALTRLAFALNVQPDRLRVRGSGREKPGNLSTPDKPK